MADFLDALLARNALQPAAIRPRPRALFEPQPESGPASNPRPAPGEDGEDAQPSLESSDLFLRSGLRSTPPPSQPLSADAPGGPASPPPGAPFADRPAAPAPPARTARPPAGIVQPAPPQPGPARDTAPQMSAAGAPPELDRAQVRPTLPGGSRSAADAPYTPALVADKRRANPEINPTAPSSTISASGADRPAVPHTLPRADHSARQEGERSAPTAAAQDPGRTVRVQPGQAALPAAPAPTAPARPGAAKEAGPSQTAQQPEPVIHISIGRIEVRAAPPPPTQTAPRTRQPAPPVSLEDYLRRNSGGKR